MKAASCQCRVVPSGSFNFYVSLMILEFEAESSMSNFTSPFVATRLTRVGRRPEFVGAS
jgi:hypothetical protein